MRPQFWLSLSIAVVAGATAAAAFAGGGASGGSRSGLGVDPGSISEANLPPGFRKTPAVTVNGKRYRFADIPGHYWKVLGRRGFAIGLHFQTDKPFPWAKGVAKGQLLYLIYAVPGTCGDGNYAKAVKAPNATVYGRVPPGFDHWHAFQGGGSRVGTWYTHIPVRTFAFAGPPGNPFAGERITAGTPKFLPVCDIVQ